MTPSAENDAPYVHQMHLNVGGTGAHPIVTLWCADCLVTVQNFDQVNSWTLVEHVASEHRARPSERERLAGKTRVIPPGEGH